MGQDVAPPLPTLNDPEVLRRVAELRRTDNVTNWYYLAREYVALALVIAPTLALYHLLPAWGLSIAWAVPATLLTIVCVGAGQHRLATLAHEAAHYMLFRHRLLNELVAEWFCMFPLLGTTHSYRVQHLGHHQYPNDPERDPDWTQMTRSGHRLTFPLTLRQFLWHGLFRHLLWPPSLIRYVLVRASFLVHQGEDTPYRMKRFAARGLRLVGVTYHVALVAVLAACVWFDEPWALAAVPPALLLAALAVYVVAPERWFAEYAIKPDLSVRWQSCLRLTFNTLALSGLAWLTYATGRPWWLYAFVLWVLPLGTSFAFFMVLRQIVQHGNADRERFTNTRIFLVHPLVSMAVFPIGNDYHLPHHLFPMVPHYNLRALHELLLQTEPYRREATVVKGYFFPPERPPQAPTVVDVLTR